MRTTHSTVTVFVSSAIGMIIFGLLLIDYQHVTSDVIRAAVTQDQINQAQPGYTGIYTETDRDGNFIKYCRFTILAIYPKHWVVDYHKEKCCPPNYGADNIVYPRALIDGGHLKIIPKDEPFEREMGVAP